MQPPPVDWNLCALEEEATCEEEEGGGRDDDCITGYVGGDHGGDEHDVGVGGDEGGEEDDPKVKDGGIEFEHELRDDGESEALDGKEGDVDDEGGDDVGGGAIGIV